MDSEKLDQGWEELQARIQERLRKYMRGGAEQSEYGAGSPLHLLETISRTAGTGGPVAEP
ncbi:MAG: hypothetical protein A4E73_01538 [Syntrophaceae bacterium PtaU1.Bin231]|nr:MAG: hypothetical protein A4E73_01538 [Syntrophaceae bacterium PtaU1.Bin231]HOG17156.1 hypothetical protein [Syntrophales bacterium]